MIKKTGFILTVFIVLNLCFLVSVYAQVDMVGKKAPDWKLKNLEGKEVHFSSFLGKVIIVDLWATWCPPCRKEIPDFIKLFEAYQDKGLVIIGISLDRSVPPVVQFSKKMGINYPIVMGDSNTPRLYGNIRSIPTTFVIDPNGKIVKTFIGFHKKSVFESEIKALLPMIKKAKKK